MSTHRVDTPGAAARAARARDLMTGASPGAELLGFYAALVEYQQGLVARGRLELGDAISDRPILDAVDAAWVGAAVRDLLHWLVRPTPDTADGRVRLKPDVTYAPPALRASADAMRDVAEEEWRALFDAYRADPDDAAARFSEAAVFALEAVLQPVAERLAAARQDAFAGGVGLQPDHGSGGHTHPRCPVCGGAPVVGVLREEGHGARRRLVCGLCLTEWDYLRLVCVKCGEQRFDALPVFTPEQFPHARIDACDTCRSYLKTIDATKDGRVVPVVDDLATIALDLWAREHGYTRVRANLVRI